MPEADLHDVAQVAADVLRHQSADLIADLTAGQREAVRMVLAQAAQRGWGDVYVSRRLKAAVGLSPKQIAAVDKFRQGRLEAGIPGPRAERMADRYAERLRINRVRLIAQNEMNLGHRVAQRMVWRNMQAVGDYSPYAVRITVVHKDERLCPVCKTQNGSRRSLKDVYGGPPFHPRCRCHEVVQDLGVEKWEHGAVTEANQSVVKAISPGGRPADDSPLARPGYKGPRRLVAYIRMVAHALIRHGRPKSEAIHLAYGIVENWAEGKGKVSPKVRAAAVKAIAEQKALEAKNKAVGAAKDVAKTGAKTEHSVWSMTDYQQIVGQMRRDKVL